MEYDMTAEITRLAISSDMEFIQINGQRLFGPPLWLAEGWKIPKGTEVFVSNLPRQCTELDVFPLFSSIGPIYQVRMMMDFSGTNRGYCFVRYFEPEHAQNAVHDLDGHEIFKGCHISVATSFDNCRLFIGGLPQNKSNDAVIREIYRASEGVMKVVIITSYIKSAFRKRFCFISYDNHRAASSARRSFLNGNSRLWGKYCLAQWAEVERN